jgi:hypothetical protein
MEFARGYRRVCKNVIRKYGAMGAIGLVGNILFPKKEDEAPMPEAVVPAMSAPTSRLPDATVRIGNNTAKSTDASAPDYNDFVEKRVFGKALGGLGRGGLQL